MAGRGALLDKLKKHKEEQLKLINEEPTRGRGRALLLAKMKTEKEKKVGLSLNKTIEEIDNKLIDQESEKFLSEVEEKCIIREKPCYEGTLGKTISASSNYIRLTVQPDRGVFEYEVKFHPDVDAKYNRIKLLNTIFADKRSEKIYDGGNIIYLPQKLFSDVKKFELPLPSNPDEIIEISIIFKRVNSFSEPHVIHLYNVLFRKIMRILLYSNMGKNYFNPNDGRLVRQHKLEVLPGYAISVEERDGGLMLCLDTQHRVIRDQTVYDLLQEIRCRYSNKFKEIATREILGSMVLTKYNNTTYKIDDIAWDMTPLSEFERNNEKITFFDYYKKHYDIIINDLTQPLLINKKVTTIDNKKVDQLICLVPEISYLTGLTDAMRSDMSVMKDVSMFTRVTPNQRQIALKNYLNKVKNSTECLNVLNVWGLQLADGAIELNARVLPEEDVWFGNNFITKGPDWNMVAIKNSVTGPINLYKWKLVFTPKDEHNAHNFVDYLLRFSKTMGCIIKPPEFIKLTDDRTETYLKICQEHAQGDVQLLLFIFPSIRTDRYSTVKKICCTQQPCASQVILSRNLSNTKKVQTIIAKIALQINCKLGGTLWSIKFPVTNWAVCGIDVYHGGKLCESVGAFVGSINANFTKYYSDAMFQTNEIGDFYKIIFRKYLYCYYTNNGAYPKKLIFFRDGVSDGQFNAVIKYEIEQFEQVLKEMNIDSQITFIIVQKRGNIRMYQLDNQRNSINAPAGTIFDNEVTKKNLYDYYLVPQTVKQGTVNPCHYVVLYDKNNIKPNHVQTLTYKLCHLYYNWCGTVRVPAPCQYAHKLAGLVGQYIKKVPHYNLCDKLYYL